MLIQPLSSIKCTVTGHPYLLKSFFTVTPKQVWIISTFRRSHLMLLPAKTMYASWGTEGTSQPSMPLANNVQVGRLCDVQSMSPSEPHTCVLMQWMVLESRDRWPTRSQCRLSVQRSTGSYNSSNVRCPVDGQTASAATCKVQRFVVAIFGLVAER